MTKAKLYFSDSNPQEINDLEALNVNVTGILTAPQINGTNVNVTGILTAPQINGTSTTSENVIGGISSVTQLTVTGISTLGITSTTTLISQQLNVSGIVTASAYVSTGTTAVYAGSNTSTVDSNTTSFHYITYDTNSTAVNISNFTPGKKFDIVARNVGGGSRSLIIRTSTTTTGHAAVPTIVHSAGTITNGTITITTVSGLLISIFNMNGTIVGSY